MPQKLQAYIRLMRFDKPVGMVLLLWPTWWALWLASHGRPPINLFLIFTLGVVVMRACGCVMNDFADRKLDSFVERTRHRPLATGDIKPAEALGLIVLLLGIALSLVCMTNSLTILLAIPGALLAMIYPLMKRITHAPQAVLGVAFSWSILMVYAATQGKVPLQAWWLFAIAVMWPLAYDTAYAMVDREDDYRAGIKSTAIWFGENSVRVIGLLQSAMLIALGLFAWVYALSWFFYVALAVTALLFLYQQRLLASGVREQYFKTFLNNQWVGLVIYIGFLMSQI